MPSKDTNDLTKYFVKTLATTILEKIVEKRPIERVTAKPLIGPSPKKNIQIAAIRVVKLASRIVDTDLSNPSSILETESLPFLTLL